MSESNEMKPKCISVFKSGESTTTERAVTEKWIALIRTLQKEKTAVFDEKTVHTEN